MAGFVPFTGGTLRIEGACEAPYAVSDPQSLQVEAAAGSSARLVLMHGAPLECEVRVRLAEGASLSVVQIFTGDAFVSFEATLAARSLCRLTTVQLAGSRAVCRAVLDGPEAECDLRGLFLAAGAEYAETAVRIDHMTSDCRSHSLVRGVAGGEARGMFRGLVHVAPGAQRTDARQQSHNILVSRTARIETQPQLEIYADDVQCSHGATVGQMDEEAIFYMRQRGLSESQARRLRLEGFVGSVLLDLPVGSLREPLLQAVSEKLERM